MEELKVYVGEGNPVHERLKAHADGKNQKDFWDEAIVFTSKDSYITKTQIQYLEFEIYRLADEAGKVSLQNNQKTTKPTLSEVDNSEMEHFIDAIKLLLSSLGINILKSQKFKTTEDAREEIICQFSVKGANARMKIEEEKYIVFKGATAVIENRPSASKSIFSMKKLLRNDDVLKKDPSQQYYTFKEDYIFSCPSYAAAIELAKTNNVELMNRDQLISMLLTVGNESTVIDSVNDTTKNAEKPTDDFTGEEVKIPDCPRCKRSMMLRKSRHGNKFFGCANFPSCRQTKSINQEQNASV